MIRAPNIKIQRAGLEMLDETLGHLPAADLERWAYLLEELYGTSPDRIWVGIDFLEKRC